MSRRVSFDSPRLHHICCILNSVHASPARVLFRRTVLPESLPRIEIRNLAVGDANADLVIEKEGEGFYVRMLRKQGALDIISIK